MVDFKKKIDYRRAIANKVSDLYDKSKNMHIDDYSTEELYEIYKTLNEILKKFKTKKN